MFISLSKVKVRMLFVLMLVVIYLPMSSRAQVTPIDTTVSDTIDVGYLTIEMRRRIDSIYVVINNHFSSPHYIANGATVKLPVGRQYLTIATKYTRDLSLPVTVHAGERDTLRTSMIEEKDREVYLKKSSYPVLQHGINLLVVTDRDSRILVDGVPRGRGATRLRMSEGAHVVETLHPEAGHTERQVFVQMDPPRLRWVEMYNKPSRGRVRGLSFLPGGAQLYKGQALEGITLASGFALAGIGGLYQHVSFLEHNQHYNQLRDQYEAAETEEEAFRLGNQTEQYYNAARRASRWRNALAAVTVGTYLYSLFDGILDRPPGGYRTPSPGSTQLRPLLGMGKQGMQLVVRF